MKYYLRNYNTARKLYLDYCKQYGCNPCNDIEGMYSTSYERIRKEKIVPQLLSSRDTNSGEAIYSIDGFHLMERFLTNEGIKVAASNSNRKE